MNAPQRLGADPVDCRLRNDSSVRFRFCDLFASLRPILRTIFTTDYADSADISLIPEHP